MKGKGRKNKRKIMAVVVTLLFVGSMYAVATVFKEQKQNITDMSNDIFVNEAVSDLITEDTYIADIEEFKDSEYLSYGKRKPKIIFGPVRCPCKGTTAVYKYKFKAKPMEAIMVVRNHKVKAAEIILNGKPILDSDKLTEKVYDFKVELEDKNELIVRVIGKKGTGLGIAIICPDKPQKSKLVLFLRLRWGHIDGYVNTTKMVPWDGFISTTDGGLKVLRVLKFETGGSYQNGCDDKLYPRTNRYTVQWRSSTKPHWDGILVAILVIPKNKPQYVTVHTTQTSKVFTVKELAKINKTVPIDNEGNKIEIIGRLKVINPHKPKIILFLRLRWGHIDGYVNTTKMVPWDGFISTTKGRIKVLRTLLFDIGGSYQNGGDDKLYPQTNPHAVKWRSSTKPHWDGILVAIEVIPTKPIQKVTVHTKQISKVFTVKQLAKINKTVPIDNEGNKFEIKGCIKVIGKPHGKFVYKNGKVIGRFVEFGVTKQGEITDYTLKLPKNKTIMIFKMIKTEFINLTNSKKGIKGDKAFYRDEYGMGVAIDCPKAFLAYKAKKDNKVFFFLGSGFNIKPIDNKTIAIKHGKLEGIITLRGTGIIAVNNNVIGVQLDIGSAVVFHLK
jgi:hypothetical protein